MVRVPRALLKSPRTSLAAPTANLLGILRGLKALGGGQRGQRFEILYRGFHAGKERLGRNHDCRIDGIARGLRRPFENGQQHPRAGGLRGVVLQVRGTVHPAEWKLVGEAETRVAVRPVADRAGIGDGKS